MPEYWDPPSLFGLAARTGFDLERLSFFPWSAMYPGIVAMALGSIAGVVCRPDLKRAKLAGGAIFFIYYLLFLIGLEISAPGYIDRVWNVEALSGWTVGGGLPLEELLFAAAFGMYWGGVYEHFSGESAGHV